jgi:hypothetical protein
MTAIRIVFVWCLIFVLQGPSAARGQSGEMMGWYFPVNLGATWTYAGSGGPADTFTESVFESVLYQGQPAYRRGASLDDHVIVQQSLGVVTVYAVVEEGVLFDLQPNAVLAELVDGAPFPICFAGVCDTSMIRIWQNVDPALQAIYDLDPGYGDLVAIASYDADHPTNLHNVVMASNLPDGVQLPAGAVTSVEWYQRGVGMVVMIDIDAATGGMVEDYRLFEVTPAAEGPHASPPRLEPGVPNPFNPRTTISFTIQRDGQVTLQVFDCLGRRVKDLLSDQMRSAGRHSVVWDGRDNQGRALPSGVYLSRLVSGGHTSSRRHTLLR